MCVCVFKYVYIYIYTPVVLHKAVAEIANIGTIGGLSCCDQWLAERTR